MSSAEFEVFHKRQCYRAFEKSEIPQDQLKEILEAAQRAPSSKNTQPWKAHLISGDALAKLKAEYVESFEAGNKPAATYQYTIEPLPEEWKQRAREVGFGLFNHKGIERGDKEKLHAHYKANFEFFDAPHVLFITLPEGSLPGNFVDAGLYAQTFMLALTAADYGSCPMFSAVSFPEILRKYMPGTEDRHFVMGIAFGKPTDEHVNQYYTKRVDIDDIVEQIR